jgi:hypothetical protein
MSKVYLYKKNQSPKLFNQDEVVQAQADGWVDTPAKIKKTIEDLTLDDLKEIADKKGVSYSHNIGKDKLIEKLREA